MRVLFSNGAEVSLYVRVLNSIIHLGSHYAGFKEEDEEDDEDDPNVAITFSSDDEKHQAKGCN